jgi:hypothetical protein
MCIPLRGYLPACSRPGDLTLAGRLVEGHIETLTYSSACEVSRLVSFLFISYAVTVKFSSVNQKLVVISTFTAYLIKVC